MTGQVFEVPMSGLDALFDDEFEAMVRLARVVSDSAADVEDIVMEAFEATAKRFDRLDRPGAYLRTAVINGARRRYRDRKRRDAIRHRHRRELAAQPAGGEFDYLADVLASLPERQRTILVLVYYLGLSPTEVAEELGCPAGTVRSLIHRTLAELRMKVAQ